MQILRQIESLFRTGTSAGLSDGQLLERFVLRRDAEAAEAAFTALVDRHGPMVLRVCRQVLGDEEDARDASQATFLVLARRAASIGRRESVGPWLHGVALRVAKKARVAAGRRRAHERRGGEMAAGRMVEERTSLPEHREFWAIVHEELGRLPEIFRAPLVLCDLEGLTQEQAAARLRAPLGTIQSRLARGRARMKQRLERRGLDASSAASAVAFAEGTSHPAPPAWAEATVRMAMSPVRRGALPSSAVGLAEDVARAMVLGRLRVLAGLILLALAMASGALTLAARRAQTESPPAVRKVADAPQADAQPRPEAVKRTIRGIVRDERGRPVPGAWIGWHIRPLADEWRIITAPDRIRPAREPYRDEKGKPIPPGPAGKYHEYRDDSGQWRAVHPAEIRRHVPRDGLGIDLDLPADLDDLETSFPDGLLEIRVAKGRWEMVSWLFDARPAPRTDPQGRFTMEVEFFRDTRPSHLLHFASPDFGRGAVLVVRPETPDRPIEVTLRPARLVRARVIESPRDHPRDPFSCHIFAIGMPGDPGDYIESIGARGVFWAFGADHSPDAPDGPRRIQARLAAGHYRARIGSTTFSRLDEFDVPEGDGPVDLSDIRPESDEWVKMLGRPAAEIEADDLEGHPVRLADHRGRVVVLVYWGSRDDRSSLMLDRLAELRKRLENQPLTLLALHDASLTSAKAFRDAMTPIVARWERAKGPPFRLLLDRPPAGVVAGELGSGRTRQIYEPPGTSTFVIDRLGRLSLVLADDGFGCDRYRLGKDGSFLHENATNPEPDVPDPQADFEGFAFLSLLSAVEEGLGLSRTPMPVAAEIPVGPPPLPSPPPRRRRAPDVPLRITGTVVGPDGKPLAGASVSPANGRKPRTVAKSDADGAFALVFDLPDLDPILLVDAPGMASRTFSTEAHDQPGAPIVREGRSAIEPDGRITTALRMGPGAVVTGRMMREGRPAPGLPIVLHRRGAKWDEGPGSHADFVLGDLEARTDDRGVFRFERMAAGDHQRYSIYAKAERPGELQVLTPIAFQAGADGETIDLGNPEVHPGRTLAGRVIFDGRQSPPRGAAIIVSPEQSGSRLATLDGDGRFAIHGIPDDGVSVSLCLADGGELRKSPMPGYHLSRKNRCLDPRQPVHLRGRIDRDISDLTILAEPGELPYVFRSLEVDPAVIADFEEASAGPITGVPPESVHGTR